MNKDQIKGQFSYFGANLSVLRRFVPINFTLALLCQMGGCARGGSLDLTRKPRTLLRSHITAAFSICASLHFLNQAPEHLAILGDDYAMFSRRVLA